jgi:subtilisin family serine protease
VVEGIERVIDHHTSGRLAVANLSLGVDIGDDGDAINAAIRRLIADGVIVIVAAGNGNSAGRPVDACMIAPANEPQAITVAAVDWNDKQSSYSNFGSCIDIYAPGGDFNAWVDAAWNANDSDYYGDAGTSMASPHVAGLAALLAEQQPGLCPQSVERAILARATPDVLVGLGAGSPNRLLYLDTSPIAEITTPGTPTNIVAVADNNALTISWDNPCDGGTQIEKSIVSVYSGARLVKKVSVAGARQVVRVGGLRNGTTYTATVRTQSLAGRGGVSSKSARVASRRLSVGSSVPVTQLMSKPQAGSARWIVAPQSSATCKIKPGPPRLVALKRGRCVVSVTTSHAETSRTHVLTIG